jgi:asparagine synthase (glutamine-hydrolysing)
MYFLQMITLRFKSSPMRSWHTARRDDLIVRVTGWALIGDKCTSDQVLADFLLEKIAHAGGFDPEAQYLDGNFAMVLQAGQSTFLVTDPIRSIPLFYSEHGGNLSVSDDARILGIRGREIDLDSAVEFITAGYVTGHHNMYLGVYGLRPGEWVAWRAESESRVSSRYFEYSCTYDSTTSLEELREEFDRTLINTFNQLVTGIGDRQVVIPLSGGLDSRLIASMFKRVGYENVICLSYGIPGNKESEVSQAVALQLGYKWKYVEYSPELWRSTHCENGSKEFMMFAANGVSIPHMSDFPAIEALRSDRLIDEDAVICPGHTGDFISGGHLKYLFDPHYADQAAGFEAAIIKKHYSLWSDLANDLGVQETISRRIHEVVGHFSGSAREDVSRKYEYWEWQERQPKLIINAIRSYEYFGFSWRMPLWSHEMMDFWSRVPLDLKMDKYLYRSYLASYDPHSLFQGDAPHGERGSSYGEQRVTFRNRSKGLLNRSWLGSKLLAVKTNLGSRIKEYRHDPLGLATHYTFLQFLLHDRTKRNVISLMVRDFAYREYGVRRSSVRTLAKGKHVV